MDTLNLATLDKLAELRMATRTNARVCWAVDGDVTRVVEGVARNFTTATGGFLKADEDVRDFCLWVSGTMERFIPVREVLSLMGEGLFTTSVK
jgi:hypothetical protein